MWGEVLCFVEADVHVVAVECELLVPADGKEESWCGDVEKAGFCFFVYFFDCLDAAWIPRSDDGARKKLVRFE